MGLRRQYQVRMKQRGKRKKKRAHIKAKGGNLNDFYYGKFYLKTGKE